MVNLGYKKVDTVVFRKKGLRLAHKKPDNGKNINLSSVQTLVQTLGT